MNDAIRKIIALTKQINARIDDNILEFYATKLVHDVLDYCRRDDFPEALCYAAAGALIKQFPADTNESAAQNDAPLKKITQDDTSFEFACADVDATLPVDERIFNTLKPRLNLYRKVVSM